MERIDKKKPHSVKLGLCGAAGLDFFGFFFFCRTTSLVSCGEVRVIRSISSLPTFRRVEIHHEHLSVV